MGAKRKRGEIMKKGESRPVSPFDEMESYFDRFFRHPFTIMARHSWPDFDFPGVSEIEPHVDIFEENGDIVIKAEIPGISKEDVNILISENTVTISGEKKQEERIEEKNFHREELRYGSFSRRFQLPENVDDDKATASFKDGVLEIRLPKSKPSKQRKIAIS